MPNCTCARPSLPSASPVENDGDRAMLGRARARRRFQGDCDRRASGRGTVEGGVSVRQKMLVVGTKGGEIVHKIGSRSKRSVMTHNVLNGGQVIVDYLIREGVPYVFGLCGHGNIQFIDALFERQDDLKTISVHHETVAGFMADVYYRVSGQPTATFTSCGPGSTNLPIALANAYLDSVPFLAVTGNIPTSQFNRGAFQELYRQYQADFPSTVRTMCKRVFQPTRGEMVPLAVRQAWKTMITGRPGPVVLDVP